MPPVGYLDFLQLMANAKLILTDSGGIQEESTILRVPCVTIRSTTERPVTVTHGTNRIAGTDEETIVRESREALNANFDPGDPEFVTLYDELKRLFEKKKLSEVTRECDRQHLYKAR